MDDFNYIFLMFMNNNFTLTTLLFIIMYKLLYTFGQKYIDLLIDRFWPSYSISIYEFDKNFWHGRKNPYYDYASYFLDQNRSLLKINQMKVEKTIIYDNKMLPIKHQNINDDYPNVIPNNDCKLYYDHGGISVIITNRLELNSKRDRINSIYLIESSNLKHIDKFMDLITLSKVDYYKKMYLPKEPHCHIYDSMSGNWVELHINCKKTFENIFIPKSIKYLFKNNIDNLANTDFYEKSGIPKKIGLLFYGLPGSGKTSSIYAIAAEYKKQIYTVNTKVETNHFYKQIRLIPVGSIVVFNDIDTIDIVHDRNAVIDKKKNQDNAKTDKDTEKDKNNNICLGDLLEILDGYMYLNECIVIMTTNHIEKLDPALIRPGRIDHKIEFSYASNDQIHQILKFYYPDNNKYKSDELFNNKNCDISYLINTLIIPNVNNIDKVLEYLKN